MNRRVAALIVGTVVVLAAVVVAWQAWRAWQARRPPAAVAGAEAESEPGTLVPFRLLFPGPGGLLHAEARDLEVTTLPRERVEAIVRALLDGPRGAGLEAPLPAGIEVRMVMLGADGTAFVDLHAPDAGPPPPSGSRREMLTVYSFVDSIALNVPEARRVVLLWNGVQPVTFAGHLATDRPLAPSMELVASR